MHILLGVVILLLLCYVAVSAITGAWDLEGNQPVHPVIRVFLAIGLCGAILIVLVIVGHGVF